MEVDIEQILETKYSDYQWSIKNSEYSTLQWSSSNEISKPTEEELLGHAENEEVKKTITDNEAVRQRQEQILNIWPVEKQFEALTENSMGRPEKLNELNNFILKTKEDFPKS